MGKLVSIIGNSGAGKTLLARLLCEAGPFQAGFEQHTERPFQALFMRDTTRYSLPNQIDYLLLRAEQERAIRLSPVTAVQDGGLDLDFYLYTRYFYRKGYLSGEEFALCERLHALLRTLLPAPDLIVYLDAPVVVLAERRAIRSRALDISRSEDLDLMQELLDDWLARCAPGSYIRIDAAGDWKFAHSLAPLVGQLHQLSAGE